MRDDDIHITVPVQVSASVTLRMPRDVWQAMTDTARRQKMQEECIVMQHVIDRDGGIQNGTADLYLTIDEALLDEASEYDPSAEG